MFRLSLEWTKIDANDEAFKEFCVGLEQNESLETLNLSNNSFSSDQGRNLAFSLRNHDSLRVLDLNFTKIGDAGASAFLDVLKVNKALQVHNQNNHHLVLDLIFLGR